MKSIACNKLLEIFKVPISANGSLELKKKIRVIFIGKLCYSFFFFSSLKALIGEQRKE